VIEKKIRQGPEESACRLHEKNQQALGGVHLLVGPLNANESQSSGATCEKLISTDSVRLMN
jgi:hypothetical protein